MAAKNLSSMSDDELRALAASNSQAWHISDAATQSALHDQNVQINSILDSRSGSTSTYNADTGKWSTTPAANSGSRSSGGYTAPSGYTGSVSASGNLTPQQQGLIDQMNKNSLAWYGAGSDEERAGLHSSNEGIAQQLAAMGLGVSYDSGAGAWTVTGLNNPRTTSEGFSYESAPGYTDKYSAQIEELLNGILNRDSFSYNALEDPLYQQYREQYLREGQRAMQDTYGQQAARTGGLGSSWAQSAAQQANNYYSALAADKMPELYQLAYEMYLDEIEGKVRDLGLLENLSGTQYSRYRDTMSDWRSDRDFAYNAYRNDVSDGRYADETAYNRMMAGAQLGAQYGDYSGLNSLGVEPDLDQMLREAMAGSGRTTPVGTGSGGSGRSGSSGGYNSGDTGEGDDENEDPWAAVDEYVAIGGDAEDYIKANYKALGYSSASAAISAYKVRATQNAAGALDAIKSALDNMYSDGASWAELLTAIHEAQDEGAISTPEEYGELYRYISSFFGR